MLQSGASEKAVADNFDFGKGFKGAKGKGGKSKTFGSGLGIKME